MNAIKTKLQSNKGASITFALLLFLVCAVISSVVIVAATAAAGRMSDQGEMDERYYAVAAAAKRLNDVFDGAEVVVKYDINAGVADISSATVEYADGTTTGLSTILAKASIDVVNGVVLKDTVIDPDQIVISDANSQVTCTVDREMKEDGRLEYTISAQKTKVNGPNSRYFTVYMSFSPNLSASVTDISTNQGQATVKWKLLGAKKNSAA